MTYDETSCMYLVEGIYRIWVIVGITRVSMMHLVQPHACYQHVTTYPLAYQKLKTSIIDIRFPIG